jgi:hypothetical protein
LTSEDIELSSDPKVVRIRKMVSSVLSEIYRMRSFVRLKALGNRVLYGYLKPRHKTGSDISRFLKIAIHNNCPQHSLESWVSLCSWGDVLQANGGALEETLEGLRSALDSEEKAHDLEEIWRVYYPSQCSPERKNITAFHRRMPRTALDSAGLKVEQNKNGLTLEDFFGSD